MQSLSLKRIWNRCECSNRVIRSFFCVWYLCSILWKVESKCLLMRKDVLDVFHTYALSSHWPYIWDVHLCAERVWVHVWGTETISRTFKYCWMLLHFATAIQTRWINVHTNIHHIIISISPKYLCLLSPKLDIEEKRRSIQFYAYKKLDNKDWNGVNPWVKAADVSKEYLSTFKSTFFNVCRSFFCCCFLLGYQTIRKSQRTLSISRQKGNFSHFSKVHTRNTHY